MDIRSVFSMKTVFRTEKGFTILEVLIAISVLSIGILAVASMQVSAMWGNNFAARQTEATTIALDRTEKLLSLSYQATDLSSGNHTDSNPPNGYSIVWNVEDDTPLNNSKRVRVTVKWSSHGAQKAVSVERIIPKMI
jgi:type IV pilus assembly protein PilV